MKRKSEIEVALERSLRKQVSVPRLNSKFDAAVWARIEAAETRAPAQMQVLTATPKAARWLYVLNVVGLASVAIFVSLFGAQMLAGMQIDLSMPELSAAAGERVAPVVSMSIAGAALVLGLMYTPIGRRLRAEFS
jgi:hypothetical protein